MSHPGPVPVPAPCFSFFPNPAREWLSLDLVRPVPPGKRTLRLVDHQGRPLQPALDLRGLPGGLYPFRLDLDGQILQTARLLVSP